MLVQDLGNSNSLRRSINHTTHLPVKVESLSSNSGLKSLFILIANHVKVLITYTININDFPFKIIMELVDFPF